MVAQSELAACGNLFLDSLPAPAAAALLDKLELVDFPLAEIISRSGEPVKLVAFPVTGSISAVNVMSDGTTIEVMLVGREGIYGTQLVLGDNISGYDTTIQIAGKILTMSTGAFLELVERDAALRQRVLTYIQTLVLSMAQFLGCNRLHSLEQRCARWLLMCHDRVPGDLVTVTHEFLAEMLGVHRPGVTVALQTMQSSGAIEQRRGSIHILNRDALNNLSCECYAKINRSAERLLGFRSSKSERGAGT